MKRRAEALCLCAEVNSPGRVTWIPVYSQPTAADTSFRLSLTKYTTRLPACSGVTNSDDFKTKSRKSSYFHNIGIEFDFGSQGSISLATVHKAPAPRFSKSL